MIKKLSKTKINLYKEILSSGKEIFIKAGGTSMWPFIKDGDILIIQKRPLNEIACGDVIVSCLNNHILCHRVIQKKNQIIHTKPDSLIGFDAPVKEDAILGKVIAREKGGVRQNWEGKLNNILGKCICIISFLWAPLIPMLRYIKRTLSNLL